MAEIFDLLGANQGLHHDPREFSALRLRSGLVVRTDQRIAFISLAIR